MPSRRASPLTVSVLTVRTAPLSPRYSTEPRESPQSASAHRNTNALPHSKHPSVRLLTNRRLLWPACHNRRWRSPTHKSALRARLKDDSTRTLNILEASTCTSTTRSGADAVTPAPTRSSRHLSGLWTFPTNDSSKSLILTQGPLATPTPR